ncbi:pyridoxamine 5'-phosphate oxidase family protein [Frankia gtarii]|uniref:pyridoxamine 5'-phosphate oxidase family protein n=1 Tax=Frankia gtarii TaxID=2950102 RepID=UPI0021BFB47B|nr:pyridoxamine 5'-phosphate oxidase family protein [Frankia gtarii]
MTRPALHEGELAVQRRAAEGRRTPAYGPVISGDFVDFIRRQRLAVIGAADAADDVWATILTGAQGFADPLDATTIALRDVPPPGDPLHGAFELARDCGMIMLDPGARKRIRANGRVRRVGDRLVMHTEQVLRNCPKYIQQREPVADAEPAAAQATCGTAITAVQRQWITDADTFFIASRTIRHGADASHRGGPPGFVTVAGPRELTWPDYKGNSFYMTFGNLELDPTCGLVFLDWSRGRTLHLTGRAWVDWNDRSVLGALRTVRFQVKHVVQVDNATALRWRFVEYSPVNPNLKEGKE